MSRAILAVAVIVLAVGTWLLLRDTRPTNTAGAPMGAPELEQRVTAELEPAPVETAREGVFEAPQTTAEPVVASAADASAPIAPIRALEVAIVVVEVDGTERRDLDGEGEAILWSGSSPSHNVFELESGRFTVPLVDGLHRIDIRDCRVAGDPLDCREASVELPHDGPLVFVLHRAASLRLRVIASDTRADLADVQVVTGASYEYGDMEHPSGRASTSIVTGGRSPLDLPPRVQRNTAFWVHAPGYAWQRVELDLARGGERLAVLEPAGTVECWITGAALPEGAELRAWRDGGHGAPGVDLIAVHGERRMIEGLTPGVWCFKVQKGHWIQEPLDVAEATVKIEAGLSKTLELTVAPPIEAPARVTVRGTLRIDEDWEGLDRLRLTLQPQGEVRRWGSSVTRPIKPVRDGAHFKWDAQIYPGRYLVVVWPSQYPQTLEVKAGVTSELVIDVPPPGEIEVRIVDAATGAPVDVYQVAWHCSVPPGVSSGDRSVPYDLELGARFQAPTGVVTISASPKGYVQHREVIEVQRGLNRVTLRSDRACGIRVELFDGETPVPLSDFGMFDIEAVDHDGRGTGNSVTWWHVSKPGAYRVTFKAIAGYRPLPPQVVTVAAGEMLTVRANLERSD